MKDATVRVGLGDRSYDVVIGGGLLETAGARIAPFLRRRRVAVVTDETVWAAQGGCLAAGLTADGVAFEIIALAAGEASKSFPTLGALLGRLLDAGVDRGDLILAFGGGVIGDLAGFAAAILRRGCRFVQIPTSLLAQVDSAVGGKTGINVAQGKNLVGAFHQPALVLADIDALATLDAREIRAGYAEIVKYGALGDADFFSRLEADGAGVLSGDRAARVAAVRRSVEMKAEIVAADERETGRRALLNLGHTFGHALEAAAGYSSRLLHGEAVAAGMGLAADFSVHLGYCPPDDAVRLKRSLAAAGLPVDLAGAPVRPGAAAMMDLMMQDKKTSAGVLSLVLLRRIGDAFVAPIEDTSALRDFLENAHAEATP